MNRDCFSAYSESGYNNALHVSNKCCFAFKIVRLGYLKAYSIMNGSSNKSAAVGRRSGSTVKQRSINFLAESPSSTGMAGCVLSETADPSDPSSSNGVLPVAISTTVHPKDHTSAWKKTPTANARASRANFHFYFIKSQ